MKIQFKDIVRNPEWLQREILNSITTELINEGHKTGEVDVKLLINGVELEPMLLTTIFNKLEEYIDAEAKVLSDATINEKMEEAEQKLRKLTDMFDEVASKIKDEFNLINYDE